MMIVILIAGGVALVSVVLTLLRLLLANRVADRIVAAELLTGVVIALLAIAAWTGVGSHALDVAIGLALVGFLGSVGLAAALSQEEERT
jgi:multicomponent Na+:H+ antiporter subunit F